jgi:two-component system CheB/CheR fusion protein
MPAGIKHQADGARPGTSKLVAAPDETSDHVMVVGIGASAGGLDACSKLLSVMPQHTGMAFIIVQHLDPNHDSLLADLLGNHTAMTVREAADGMKIAADTVYVIAPNTYLSVSGGTLHASAPLAPHGARMPFDFLLASLAKARGKRAICIILSGTGTDGSLGLRDIKAQGGLVIAEAPEQADFDGMPRSAIATGLVDLVSRIDAIPGSLAAYAALGAGFAEAQPRYQIREGALHGILDLLRTNTAHDFTSYKPGTLERRISRRIAMAGFGHGETAKYLDFLSGRPEEQELLAKDLLINVTSFFRDASVFDLLATDIIPGLVRSQGPDHTIRLWVAGCSTGEETYSLAMLFREEISAAQPNVKLQIFASDVDRDAIAIGREGLYPFAIERDVSAARLARFFHKDDDGYRASQELRSTIVFTVQDLLADPPFSRMDMISCRNLLIYLLPEAQAKVISRFHFALRQGGYLLLGSAEALGDGGRHFESVSKTSRLFKHVAKGRTPDMDFARTTGSGIRTVPRIEPVNTRSRPGSLSELCRRLVIDNYAPAAILINQKHECLFTLGPLDRYLRVAPGQPTHDVLAMARPGLRTRLRAAIERAWEGGAKVSVPGGTMIHDVTKLAFSLDLYPIMQDGDKLLLVCFIDMKQAVTGPGRPALPADTASLTELERELEATRAELRAAINTLEVSGEEQTAINEEALSVNEEYQSTNEELLTSKEELQSLNEELTALNSQLQETLERQRTTSNDLQNVLYSTNVATVFLDRQLNIRFFTPATKALFNVIAADIGRPLSDLKALAADTALLDDAALVLGGHAPMEQEIPGPNGVWYMRRVLPYRGQDTIIDGVVITFADVTERRLASEALNATKRDAETANRTKSRFLAAASHDLRQPLQALTLLQGLLAKSVEGTTAKRLVALLDPTLSSMTTMLNTLLDINQIDAGTVHAQISDFPIGPLLDRLKEEFGIVATSCGLDLRVVPCAHIIRSDPRLLEQMLRNLLSNALKYTKRGRVLLGCRHRAGILHIEVWDTGIGIPAAELAAIFDEYHQVDNAARERSLGLGLGLSIVKRLGILLGHRVRVQSRKGFGSMFAIEVARMPTTLTKPAPMTPSLGAPNPAATQMAEEVRRHACILAVEDDPELRDLLELTLTAEGHNVTTAPDGIEALATIARGKIRPDLILADYNLPGGMTGLDLATKLRERLHYHVPVIILTGDISTDALRDISAQDCVQIIKPVKPDKIVHLIQRMLRPLPAVHGQPGLTARAEDGPPVIYVVDDDSSIRASIRETLESSGMLVEDYQSCEEFLDSFRPAREACLLVDAYLPGMHGIDLLRRLQDYGHSLPSIMITGDSDVGMAVQAMKAGAIDLLEKPVSDEELIESVKQALELSRDASKLSAARDHAADSLTSLTERQRQVMAMVLAGHPSKNIAADLGISQRTVENHRASIMHRTGSRSLPALARLVATAAWQDDPAGA